MGQSYTIIINAYKKSGVKLDGFTPTFPRFCPILPFMVDADALLVPLVEAMNALVDFNLVVPAEAVQFAHVGEFLQRAVGL